MHTKRQISKTLWLLLVLGGCSSESVSTPPHASNDPNAPQPVALDNEIDLRELPYPPVSVPDNVVRTVASDRVMEIRGEVLADESVKEPGPWALLLQIVEKRSGAEPDVLTEAAQVVVDEGERRFSFHQRVPMRGLWRGERTLLVWYNDELIREVPLQIE